MECFYAITVMHDNYDQVFIKFGTPRVLQCSLAVPTQKASCAVAARGGVAALLPACEGDHRQHRRLQPAR
jgi:hypothetical protein